MTLNILGTEYTVEYKSKAEDAYLLECDGYCDKSSKRIVVSTRDESCELAISRHIKRRYCGTRSCTLSCLKAVSARIGSTKTSDKKKPSWIG